MRMKGFLHKMNSEVTVRRRRREKNKEIKLELLVVAMELLKINEPPSLKAFAAEIKRLANLLE